MYFCRDGLERVMCYTASTSIKAFLVAFVSSILLLRVMPTPSGKVLAWFFLFVACMQLYDAVFWTYPTGSLNRLVTKIACITNHLQPIVLAWCIVLFMGKLKPWSSTLVKVYTILIMVYTVSIWRSLDITQPTKESGDSLYWAWNHGNGAPYVYAYFLLVLCWLLVENVPQGGTVAAGLTAISFFFSLYKYQITASTGRFWCYFAAYAPLLMLGYFMMTN